MKSCPKSVRTLLAAFAAMGAIAATSFAQSVTTAPVGAVTKTVPVGLSTLGITLVNPDLAVASCSANGASDITLSGVSNVGSLLTAGIPYYVEVVGGTLEGERFEVDTAATIASANSSIALVSGSATNTFTLSAGNLVGSQVALRRHVTLSQIQSMFTTALVASTNTANADQIRLFNPATGAFITYALRTSTTWVQGSTNANNVAVPPGVGILFRKVGAAADLVVTGNVRVNDFSMPMAAGLSFRALPYPISYSPSNLGGTIANGWTGASTQGSADQIRTFNVGTGAFVTSFLRTTGAWAQGSSTVTTTPIMAYDEAFLLSRRAADSDYILVSPITL